MRPIARCSYLILACLSLGSCSSILGIEEARCSERLDPRCAGEDGSETEVEESDTDAPSDEETASDDPTTDEVDAETEEADSDVATDESDSDPEEPDTDEVDSDDETDAPPELSDGTDVDEVTDGADAGDVTDGNDDGGRPSETPDTDVDAGVPEAPDTGVEPPPEITKADVCASYCTALTANCTDDNIQFPNETSCNEVCDQLMLLDGEQPDGSLNTIECRAAAADDAEVGEPELNCQVASMVGGDFCGEPCEVYCAMAETACGELFTDTFTDCLSECGEIPRTGEPFTPDVTSGNSLECRFNHLRLAVRDRNPDLHCPHVVGQSPCN